MQLSLATIALHFKPWQLWENCPFCNSYLLPSPLFVLIGTNVGRMANLSVLSYNCLCVACCWCTCGYRVSISKQSIISILLNLHVLCVTDRALLFHFFKDKMTAKIYNSNILV